MTTTADFIREMRALCEKATPPPWSIGRTDLESGQTSCSVGVFDFLGGKSRFNAAFIAAARIALPEALDRLEKLERVRVAAKFTVENSLLYRIAGGLELEKALREAEEE